MLSYLKWTFISCDFFEGAYSEAITFMFCFAIYICLHNQIAPDNTKRAILKECLKIVAKCDIHKIAELFIMHISFM